MEVEKVRKNNLCQSVKSPIRGPVFFVEIRGIRGHAFISREEREDTRSRRVKSEARNSKSETNPNDQTTNDQNHKSGVRIQGAGVRKR
jgi:hypothetical protein